MIMRKMIALHLDQMFVVNAFLVVICPYGMYVTVGFSYTQYTKRFID